MIIEVLICIFFCENVTGNCAAQMRNFNFDEDIMVLQNEFHIQHPTILTTSKSTSLMKKLFPENNYIKTVKKDDLKMAKIYQNLIFFIDDWLSLQDLQSLLIDLESGLLIFPNDSQFYDAYLSIEIRIDQKIYFYKTRSQELFESYQINNREIKQKLGIVDRITKKFVWEHGIINSDFITRRSNFHGLILRG